MMDIICRHCGWKKFEKTRLGNIYCSRCGQFDYSHLVKIKEEKSMPELSKNGKWALFYLKNLGWSIIPVEPAGKKPLVKWGDYIGRKPTVEEVQKWWTDHPEANIGVVTGKISGISVIDIDQHEGSFPLEYMQKLYFEVMPDERTRPWDYCYSTRTGSGGYHWIFNYCPDLVSRRTPIPAVDVKSDGGYIVLPPSVNKKGEYRWIKKPWGKDKRIVPSCPIPPMYRDIFDKHPFESSGKEVMLPQKEKSLKENGNGMSRNVTEGEDQLPESDYENVTKAGQKSGQNRDTVTGVVTASHSTFGNRIIEFKKGARDESLFHLANCLFRGGMSAENVRKVVDDVGRMVCDPPFAEAGTKFWSALQRDGDRVRPLANDIEEWIFFSEGVFTNDQLDRELGIFDKKDKRNRRKIMQRLRERGVIEFANGKAGMYRRVEDREEPIDFVNVVQDHRYDEFKWPFGIEEYFMLMPKNVVILTGTDDTGKTALLLNIVKDNMKKYPINYFSSEMGDMEFQSRLLGFDLPLTEWNFKPFERDENFGDVIRPDEVNIIDYLELHDNFYQVGGYIKSIWQKLRNGVAIIAIQKNPGSDNPLGGRRAREKARLVLNIDRVKTSDGILSVWVNRLSITKAKNWKTIQNPTGLYKDFEIEDGCNLKPIRSWGQE